MIHYVCKYTPLEPVSYTHLRVLKIVGSQEHLFFIEGNDDADDMGFFSG